MCLNPIPIKKKPLKERDAGVPRNAGDGTMAEGSDEEGANERGGPAGIRCKVADAGAEAKKRRIYSTAENRERD